MDRVIVGNSGLCSCVPVNCFDYVSLVEFMHPVFNGMPGGVIVGDAGSLLLWACSMCDVTSIVPAQLLPMVC